MTCQIQSSSERIMTSLNRIQRQLFNTTVTPIKFISADKWRSIMLSSLQKLTQTPQYDRALLADLINTVRKIPEDRFVHAILSIQPFRPKFNSLRNIELCQSFLSHTTAEKNEFYTAEKKKYQSNGAISSGKRNDVALSEGELGLAHKATKLTDSIFRFKQEVNSKIEIEDQVENKSFLTAKPSIQPSSPTEEETLRQEFDRQYHPFRRIIDNFVFILEHKFARLGEEGHVERVQELLIYDIKLLTELMLRAAEPYINIFKTKDIEEKHIFKCKMHDFMRQYIGKHIKINHLVRKIMRLVVKNSSSMRTILPKIPDFVSIDSFNIPQPLKIEGCFIRAIGCLMEFSETHTSKESLEKLIEFRKSIMEDIDDFCEAETFKKKDREVQTDVQLEIVKFVLSKLKGWVSDIYSQLRYLEVMYGDEDMAFKYDEASYMYAQISTAFEVLEFEANSP